MKPIKLFDVGPTHQLLVESVLSKNEHTRVEELSNLPPLERQAAALHWYAYEIRRNGLTNLRFSELLRLEICSALHYVKSEAARSAVALLIRLDKVEEEDVADSEHFLSTMLDVLLADAEEYFSRELGVRKAKAPKDWKIVLTMAVCGDAVFAAAFLSAYLTRATDGGAWLHHMQRGLPFAILANIIYAVLWLPDSPAGKWFAKRWFALALAGLGLHLVYILAILAARGETAEVYLNLRFFALGVGCLLVFTYFSCLPGSLYFFISTLPEQGQMLRALLLQPHRGITDQMRENFALALERRAARRKSKRLARLAGKYRDWLSRC
jgi:hypothetical protein